MVFVRKCSQYLLLASSLLVRSQKVVRTAAGKSENVVGFMNATLSQTSQRAVGSKVGAHNSWTFLQGAGKKAPTGSDLQTDQYTALRHGKYGIILELFHGSTGAVMFKGSNQEKGIVSEPRWLGWDGSIKSGLDGRIDFSAWLAPTVVRQLEDNSAAIRPLNSIDQLEAGYWIVRALKESKGLDDKTVDAAFPAGLGAGEPAGIITNAKSPARILLTEDGFVFRTEGGALLVVAGAAPPRRVPPP